MQRHFFKFSLASAFKGRTLLFNTYSFANLQDHGSEEIVKHNSSEDSDDPHNLKIKLLKESLKFVPEYGWSKYSIIAGAKALGLPEISHSIITKGGADLVIYFNFSCNEKLEEILKETSQSNKVEISTTYLYDSLKTRLKMIIPYLSKWPEAMALMALPQHVTTDLSHLLHLVDTIWYYGGDKNVYMKWYARRLSLASIFKLSELHLIRDISEDQSKTWRFLEQRLTSLIETELSFSEVTDNIEAFKEISEGAAITVGNLLGINSWSRK